MEKGIGVVTEAAKQKIRARREKECFQYCDRAMWVDSLSKSQKMELKAWRAKWLDATKTGIIPAKPAWIK